MKSTNAILDLLFSKHQNNNVQEGILEIPGISTERSDNNFGFETNENIDTAIISDSTSTITENKENIFDEEIKIVIQRVLDYTHSKYIHSDNISDFLIIFKHTKELIGKLDFLCSILFYNINEEKLYKKWGFKSIEKFLDSLPSLYRVSRQTFYNMTLVGKMICYFSIWHNDSILEFKLTPKLFHCNYSKIKLLYRIHYIYKLDITNEIMVKFRDLSYRDFEIFANAYMELNATRKKRYYHKRFLSKQNKELLHFLRARPVNPPTLDGVCLEIYNEAKLGHEVDYISSANPIFIDSVLKYLKDAYNIEEDNKNQNTYSSSKIFYEGKEEISLDKTDWADFIPDDLNLTIRNISDIVIDLKPHELREAIIKNRENKIELVLAQASLIYLIEHNIKIHESICEFFKKNNIECNSTLEMDFATKILDFNKSYYKWLKRIGHSIPYLKQLTSIVILSDGDFLDKLSYLKTAFHYHGESSKLITEAFFSLSSKNFRKFACNRNDNLSSNLINNHIYQKVKNTIFRVNLKMDSGKPFTVITLKSEMQKELLSDINQAVDTKDRGFMKCYPDIKWDSALPICKVIEEKQKEEERILDLLFSLKKYPSDMSLGQLPLGTGICSPHT